MSNAEGMTEHPRTQRRDMHVTKLLPAEAGDSDARRKATEAGVVIVTEHGREGPIVECVKRPQRTAMSHHYKKAQQANKSKARM